MLDFYSQLNLNASFLTIFYSFRKNINQSITRKTKLKTIKKTVATPALAHICFFSSLFGWKKRFKICNSGKGFFLFTFEIKPIFTCWKCQVINKKKNNTYRLSLFNLFKIFIAHRFFFLLLFSTFCFLFMRKHLKKKKHKQKRNLARESFSRKEEEERKTKK